MLEVVQLHWPTGEMVSLFEKGDGKVCSVYKGSTLLGFQRVQSTVKLGVRWKNVGYVLAVKHWASFLLAVVFEGAWEFAHPVYVYVW